ARDFASSRRVIDIGKPTMSRLYVAEPTPSITGSNADHRIPIAAGQIKAVVEDIAERIGATAATGRPVGERWFEEWMQAVVGDLLDNRGAGVVLAGEGQPSLIYDLIERINHTLGNIGATVVQRRPAVERPS